MTLPKSIHQWSIDDVVFWLNENHFEMVVDEFKENLIDGKALVLLSHNDIQELIKKIGPRVKVRAKLSQLLTSCGMKNNLERKQQTNEGSYNMVPPYQTSGNQQQYISHPQQRFQYNSQTNNIPNNNLTTQQRIPYQTIQQPIKNNYQSVYPINNSHQHHLTNETTGMRLPQQYQEQHMQTNEKSNTSSINGLNRPETSKSTSGCRQCEEERLRKQKNVRCSDNTDMDTSKFLETTTVKKEFLTHNNTESNTENKDSQNNHNIKTENVITENKCHDNNENMDPNEGEQYFNEETNNAILTAEEISNASFEEMTSMMEDEHFPVLDISNECNEATKISNASNNCKLSLEAVTNRLALRERSKIFRRSEKKWHLAVNETAFQLVLKDPALLMRKKYLRLMAESEVRKTYRFAKGKSRSIAIPENRMAAEERKKQKLTKEKIFEMKRQITTEGEELSRRMRQCHMNLTLATQQSDSTKTRELRDEMQKLNQQQAKLHFTMDELLTKERKLDSGVSKVLKAPNMPSSNLLMQENNSNTLDINSPNSLSPQCQVIDTSHHNRFVSSQNNSFVSSQTTTSLSPQLPQQVQIDEVKQIMIPVSNSNISVEKNGEHDVEFNDLSNNEHNSSKESSNIAYVNI